MVLVLKWSLYSAVMLHWKLLENHCSLQYCLKEDPKSFAWLFCSVEFHMFPKFSYFNGCIVTLVAFVCLFPTVCFQMCPQTSCMHGCKVTMVAFLGFVSTVCFQMVPQNTFPKRYIIALFTIHRFVAFVCFHMCPQIGCLRGCIVTLVAFVWFFFTTWFLNEFFHMDAK